LFDIDNLRNNNNALQNQTDNLRNNKINGMELGDYIFNKVLTHTDPVEYCHRVLRAHLPEKRRYLHENQVQLVRAVCNPHIRQVSALMARQTGKTESIASFSGFLADNYPSMRIGIFTSIM
jgi:hypothetical protein